VTEKREKADGGEGKDEKDKGKEASPFECLAQDDLVEEKV
jgi:hypothetical protein